jgi:hypothetical protein
VPIGEDESYGMGLMIDRRFGLNVIHHGGDLEGFHSDWFAVTDADVGAVLLTNGDNGAVLRGLFGRRLLEVLYDGEPRAARELAASAAQNDAEIAKERPHLTVPPDATAASALAEQYRNADLGTIHVIRSPGTVVFDTELGGGLYGTPVYGGTPSFPCFDTACRPVRLQAVSWARSAMFRPRPNAIAEAKTYWNRRCAR